MKRSGALTLGGVAAFYLLWLILWLVLGDLVFGVKHYSWSQSVVAGVAAVVAWHASRRVAKPYPAFLLLLGLGLFLLALSWVTYNPDELRPFLHLGGADLPDYSDIVQAGSVFLWVCAWGYLAITQWQRKPPTALTVIVFVLMMVGLAGILANFYFPQYRSGVNTPAGRLYSVIAGLELLTLGIGLGCILLGQPAILTWLLIAMSVLVATDMVYALATVPAILQPIWMFGEVLLVGVLVALPGALASEPSEESGENRRSSLSGVLLLLSLGAVLLTVALWLSPIPPVWRDFFSILFVVGLVVVLVWITDRFDGAVRYLKRYAVALHRQQLSGDEWRTADRRIRTLLSATGLGTYLDTLRASAARLKQDVLFLGPERLYPPPKQTRLPGQVTCFIVMPFSLEWSSPVHRSLVSACQGRGVHAVRGDNLFTPTDILDDIWYALNDADFVIADITDRNANVLYELGIAHALAKPVLILSQQVKDIPIDLSTRRVILYGQTESGWSEELTLKVSRAIQEILNAYRLQPISEEAAPGENITNIKEKLRALN